MKLSELQTLAIIKQLLDNLDAHEVERIMAYLDIYLEHKIYEEYGE